ncbi:MAG: hypothetical protein JXQ72_02995 [Anaerolineae bacterium]|nr:hypothetical protein [Anaerolineae bacterium]
MDVFNLAQRLRDPDPRARVETLRILAMVEETRALGAVAWVCKNDPEPGVREVADWAGRIIFAAHKRGHSTQQAVEAMFASPLSPDRQELFLSVLEFELAEAVKEGGRATRRFAAEQTYQRRLDEVLRVDGPAADELPEALPAPADARPESEMSDEELLDAGLTDLFVE